MAPVNVVAPYLLTALIDRPQRLIYVSSSMHRGGRPSLTRMNSSGHRTTGSYSDGAAVREPVVVEERGEGQTADVDDGHAALSRALAELGGQQRLGQAGPLGSAIHGAVRQLAALDAR